MGPDAQYCPMWDPATACELLGGCVVPDKGKDGKPELLWKANLAVTSGKMILGTRRPISHAQQPQA